MRWALLSAGQVEALGEYCVSEKAWFTFGQANLYTHGALLSHHAAICHVSRAAEVTVSK